MSSAHCARRKSKSDKNSDSLTLACKEDWDTFLEETCGSPGKPSRKLPAEAVKFALHARNLGYKCPQIVKALQAKFGIKVSDSTCLRAIRRGQEEANVTGCG